MARAMQGFYIIYKNLIEFRRRSGGKNLKSFFPGACTSEKILYALQVWNLCALAHKLCAQQGAVPFKREPSGAGPV